MRIRSRSHSASPGPGAFKPRKGMTLIEVIVAMTLLAGALLSMGAFIARYAKIAGTMAIRSEANELVADRLESVKGAVRYATMETVYGGTEASIPYHPGFARQTLVTHTGGLPPSLYDYKTVTVIVTAPALSKPAKKSTVVSVF
jgi:prepilin-type N-terminal cleavage/methylation domain-containing protein